MWSPCTLHQWEKTDRHLVYNCTVCGIEGFSSMSTSPWGKVNILPVKTYGCPKCHGDTPLKGDICPRCLPKHPFHTEIAPYDREYVRFLGMPLKQLEFLRKLRALGNGPHRVHRGNGFVRCGGITRSLNTNGLLDHVPGERYARWSIPAKVLGFMKEDDG